MTVFHDKTPFDIVKMYYINIIIPTAELVNMYCKNISKYPRELINIGKIGYLAIVRTGKTKYTCEYLKSSLRGRE
jgi:hypothetical protein